MSIKVNLDLMLVTDDPAEAARHIVEQHAKLVADGPKRFRRRKTD